MLAQSWIVDYPMIAYNSYEPENSEIILCNFAQKPNKLQKLHLGRQWDFVCFINTVKLSETLEDLEKMSSQILFLAYHRKLLKYIIFVLEKNPWDKLDENKTGIKVHAYTTNI